MVLEAKKLRSWIPQAGTSTYPLAIITKVLNEVEEFGGKGLVPQAAQRLSENLYAFETLVGPYAVSHLRLSRVFSDSGASLDGSGVNVFLTDTLAAPAHEELMSRVPLFTKKLAEEQSRASRVKGPDTEITVVIGNPPWDRDSSGRSGYHRPKGRHGEARVGWKPSPARRLLESAHGQRSGEHSLRIFTTTTSTSGVGRSGKYANSSRNQQESYPSLHPLLGCMARSSQGCGRSLGRGSTRSGWLT